MQELNDSIKRWILRITGIEEEEVQAKGISNIFNKMTENFLSLAHSGTGSLQDTKHT
jgi:hypothetical protein